MHPKQHDAASYPATTLRHTRRISDRKKLDFSYAKCHAPATGGPKRPKPQSQLSYDAAANETTSRYGKIYFSYDSGRTHL